MVHNDTNRLPCGLSLRFSLSGLHAAVSGVLLGRVGPDQEKPRSEGYEGGKENHFKDGSAGLRYLELRDVWEVHRNVSTNDL